MTLTGGCRCGASRYVLRLEREPPVYCCHCRDCQTWSGSAFTQQAIVPEDAVEASGSIVSYSFRNPSGSTSTQQVCGTCHTRLWNTSTARPGVAMVRAGTFDHSDTLEPRAHMWVSRKQPWIGLPDDVPSWPENPPAGALQAALQE